MVQARRQPRIPDDIIERRYKLGIANLFRLFMPIVDEWYIYDNSFQLSKKIARGGIGRDTVIIDKEKFDTLKGYE